jgi:hypothetical protein
MIRRFTYFLLAICTTGLLVLGFGQHQPAHALPNCFSRGEIVAQVDNPQPHITGDRAMQSFVLLEMPGHWQKLVGTDVQGQCFDYIGQKTKNVTLTAFMPVDLATNLAAQRWSKSSTASIRSLITASSQDRHIWLAPEDVLAFHQMGYKISPKVKVLPALSTYQFSSAPAL